MVRRACTLRTKHEEMFNFPILKFRQKTWNKAERFASRFGLLFV